MRLFIPDMYTLDLRDISLASISFRIILALLIGGFLGLDRGINNRPAGFRTYMLVCLGATLVMMTNQYVWQYFQVSDPVRMGAQVVSGIGFLGAGAIIITGKSQVKGITTAAGLWTSACSGLAIGIGFYEGAVLGALAILFVISAMRTLDSTIRQHAKEMILYVEIAGGETLGNFITYARRKGFSISQIQVTINTLSHGEICAVLSVKSPTRCDHAEICQSLSEAPGVEYLEEVKD